MKYIYVLSLFTDIVRAIHLLHWYEAHKSALFIYEVMN